MALYMYNYTPMSSHKRAEAALFMQRPDYMFLYSLASPTRPPGVASSVRAVT